MKVTTNIAIAQLKAYAPPVTSTRLISGIVVWM